MKKIKLPKVGRPSEGRVRMTIHVIPDTLKKIISEVIKSDLSRNTQGKIVDGKFK